MVAKGQAVRVLILGGTGAFASRVTEASVARGHRVMVVSRGHRPLLPSLAPDEREPAVEWLHADRKELAAHRDVLAAFAPEAVVDAICFGPTDAADLVSLFAEARRVVLISTVDVYGEEIGCAPVSETRPTAPVSDYAVGKRAAEQVVLDGLGGRATVIRPSHILGRGFLTTSLWGRSTGVVERLLRGDAVPVIDGGRNLMTPVHSSDLAAWVVASFDEAAADGQVINGVGGDVITLRHYHECIARALDVPLRVVAVPAQVLRRHVGAPIPFGFHRPYSCRKAVELLGHEPRSTPEAMMAETVEAMLRAIPATASAGPSDDGLVALLVRHENELGRLLAAPDERACGERASGE